MNSMIKYGTWANPKTDFRKTNKTYRLQGIAKRGAELLRINGSVKFNFRSSV